MGGGVMPKFKLVVTRDGKTVAETVFDAKDKESADVYGPQLAHFGGFNEDDKGTTVKVTAARKS